MQFEKGWLYLAVVLDIFSRMVVGWAMDQHREEALVEQAHSWRSRVAILSQVYCIILTMGPPYRMLTERFIPFLQ